MGTHQIDIQQLMERLGNSGVTMLIKVDHERMEAGGKPWTILMSGPGMGDGGIVHTDCRSLNDCLEYGISELRTRPGDWEWLDDLS